MYSTFEVISILCLGLIQILLINATIVPIAIIRHPIRRGGAHLIFPVVRPKIIIIDLERKVGSGFPNTPRNAPNSPPFIDREYKNISVIPGQTIRFDPKFSANPKPEISYLKSGQPIMSNDRIKVSDSLIIDRAGVDDTGLYTMVVKNSMGQDQIDFFVEVSSPAVKEVPSPAIEEVPSSVVKEVPSPAVEEVPSPAVKEVPSPAVKEVPSPAVKEVPSPAVTDVPSHAVEEVPSPAVKEVPSPAVKEVPSPAVEEVPSSVVTDVAPPKSECLKNPECALWANDVRRNSVTLKWDHCIVNPKGEYIFQVARSQYNSGVWEELVNITDFQTVANELKCKTEYIFRVQVLVPGCETVTYMSFPVLSKGTPDAPIRPLSVAVYSLKKLNLTWPDSPPVCGLPIDNYIIEKQYEGSEEWHPFGTPLDNSIEDHDIDKIYRYRITAVNKYGISEPLVSKWVNARQILMEIIKDMQ